MRKIAWKRAALLILALAMVFAVAVQAAACNKGGGASYENTYDPNAGVDLGSELIEIAADGASDYTIVMPAEETECENFAAAELQSFIRRATGALLPIVSENAFGGGRHIAVGDTDLFASFAPDYDYSALRLDGFTIQTSAQGDLYITGARDRGTLYGVYDFLEKFVGVRFVTADYTYVPQADALRVHSMNVAEVPAFDVRAYWTADTESDALFAARMRTGAVWNTSSAMYGGGLYRDFFFNGHNVLSLTDAEENFDAHPECFSEINGSRVQRDICWTNGVNDDGSFDSSAEVSTAKLLVEGLKEVILDNPDVLYYFVGQEDSTTDVCTCSRCTAVKNKYGSVSAGIVRMLNAVAGQLQQWADAELNGKKINLAAYAYTYSEMPPVRVNSDGSYARTDDQVLLADNVYIVVTPATNGNHAYSYTDDRQKENAKIMFGGWDSLTDNLMVYDYLTNFPDYLWYIPNLGILKDNLQYFRDLGMTALIFEADKLSDNFQANMKTYIASRLMWNPDRNVRDLLDEFLSLYFGAYADDVSSYIGAMEAHVAYLRDTYGSDFNAHMSSEGNLLDADFWPAAFLRVQEKNLQNVLAEIAADGSLSQEDKDALTKRVSSVLATPQTMLYTNYTSYYGLAGRDDYAAELVATCEAAGLSGIGSKTLDQLRSEHGIV